MIATKDKTKPRGEALRTPGMKTATKPAKLVIPVSFGTVSFDDKAAHLPIAIKRGELGSPSIHDADRNLCGRQVTASIVARPEGKGTAAGGMFEEGPAEDDIQVFGIFSIGSLTVSPKVISGALAITLVKLDRDKITRFASREGLLTITHVHALAGAKPQLEEAHAD